MRVACDSPHSTSTTTSRSRTASQRSESTGFADTLASAVESSESGSGSSRPPGLSAATYRLFAAVALERGDVETAARHLSRVPDAREAGLPVQPSGVLSESGRWDYTEAAAALPETGRFDSANGQGRLQFIPYNTYADADTPPAEDCAGETAATTDAPPAPTEAPRVRGGERGERGLRLALREAFDLLRSA
jgi:hypothetical protein